jgi:succinate dehydrogenase/fumarate reductase flavoprotein subunit
MYKGDIYGAAVGFGAHLTNGVFCGWDDTEGKTSIEGLYVAGDGMNGAGPTGSAYPCGVGFTSNFVSLQGNHAGAAAASYAAGAELTKISAERVAEETEAIQAPLNVENGFDPNWARDQLMNIMSPYWVYIAKSEETLQAALTQVEILRDKVMPKLQAANYHDVRLCLEMQHKILNAELSLRASLARKETRGLHYRTDYPYRDDENFLCILTLQKNADGTIDIEKVPVKDEWKGDLNADYKDRYTYYFPNELETLGLPAEEASTGWGH